jgi:SAM-dependent methyltransferase
VISQELLARLACPECLEPNGCAACSLPAADHEGCVQHYSARRRCPCGGPDKVRLEPVAEGLRCPCCGVVYRLDPQNGFVDLTPARLLGALTQYADQEFHERLQVKDAPPFLSARIKAGMMRRMLGLRSGERVLDLGCGAGKFSLYAAGRGALACGIDIAPYFLPRALETIDLVRGDLRRLPFRKAAFPKAYSLDVLEHLDQEGVCEVLVEAGRTLEPGGALFVYTHAMESSRLARFQRLTNRLARRLGAWGLVDHEREAMRKSDHVNAIRSHEHFDELCARAGLCVYKRRYYNVVFKPLIEDLLLRLIEQALKRRRRSVAAAANQPATAGRAVGATRPGRLARSAATLLTWPLWLDPLLFGRIRTGPFFGLLRTRVNRPRGGAPV